MIDFRDKRILVTGASSGIGRQTAIALAARGAELIITGRDTTRLKETESLLRAGNHKGVVADLTKAEDVQALAKVSENLDGLVHCAGREGLAPARLAHAKLVDEIFDANFKSFVLLTQQLLIRNRMKQSSSIVIVSSIAAHTGTAGVGPYSASKAALEGYARAVALELAPKRMRINCIAPALVRTPMFLDEEKEWLDNQEKRYPLGLGTPEDVANAAIFLLSPLSSHVTGATLVMDGGCLAI